MLKKDWLDNPAYYVSIIDGDRHNVVAGPFRVHQEALDMVEPAQKIGREIDPKSHFYAWGTVKMANAHRTGILNSHLDLDI